MGIFNEDGRSSLRTPQLQLGSNQGQVGSGLIDKCHRILTGDIDIPGFVPP